MSHTAKLVQARDRIEALAGKKHDDAVRAEEATGLPEDVQALRIMDAAAQTRGLNIAVRVIEDLLQE